MMKANPSPGSPLRASFTSVFVTAMALALSGALGACSAGVVSARVVHPPAPLNSGGDRHLVWELAVRNGTKGPVKLHSVTVEVEGVRASVLEGAQLLSQAIVLKPADRKRAKMGVVGPGETALVYLWHRFTHKDRLPSSIAHRVLAKPTDEAAPAPRELEVTGAILDLEPRVVSAPLAGPGWFSANAPHNGSRHRRHAKRLGGTLHMAQRFAVDFVKIAGPSGTRAAGTDPKVNASYAAYGSAIYSVAKGVVLKVVDGIPENIPGSHRAVAMSEETLAGNLVIVDLGDDHFVTYAHLIPGSVNVKVGDVVSAGQILGKVGNSGNSTEPHLHIHVCDAPSVLRCQGLPFAFEAFSEIPITMRPGAPPVAGSERRVEGELPVNNGFLKLPQRP